MKIPELNTGHRNKIILGLLLLLIVAGGLYFFFIYNHSRTDTSINLSPASEDQKNAGSDTKDRFADPKKDNVQTDNQTPPTTSTDQSVSIISATQDDSIGKIVIKTKLPGSSWQTCSLTLTSPTGQKITKSAPTIYQPSYTVCEGFSIDRTEFTSTGRWTVSLSVSKIDGGVSDATASIDIR